MKTLSTMFLQTLIIYTIIYLVNTFIIWKFENPFLWLINMPNYSQGSRFLILFYYTVYTLVSLICWSNYYKKNLKN